MGGWLQSKVAVVKAAIKANSICGFFGFTACVRGMGTGTVQDTYSKGRNVVTTVSLAPLWKQCRRKREEEEEEEREEQPAQTLPH